MKCLNVECKNVKSCVQAAGSIRYLAFFLERIPKVFIHDDVHSMSDHAALHKQGSVDHCKLSKL